MESVMPSTVPSAVPQAEPRRGFPWWVAGLVALLALVAFGLSRMGRREAAAPVRVSAPMTAPTATLAAGDVSALDRWLAGSGPVPQRFLLDVRFATDSADLEPSSRSLLDDVAGSLAAHPGARVRVEGHTDATGQAEANRQLSQARAEATKRYLTDRGVAANRIETAGYGPDRPIAPNDSPNDRAKNRRTELVVIAR